MKCYDCPEMDASRMPEGWTARATCCANVTLTGGTTFDEGDIVSIAGQPGDDGLKALPNRKTRRANKRK
jgi:hypothetical protein